MTPSQLTAAAGVAFLPLFAVAPGADSTEWLAAAAWGFYQVPSSFVIESTVPFFGMHYSVISHSSNSAEFVSAGD